MPKGVYPHTHIKPRVYPDEIVQLVRRLYLDEGMTVVEVQAEIPKGYKAQRIIERYIPQRRSTAKRDQTGDKNDSWRGDSAEYKALHLRVQNARGKPSLCSRCGTTKGRFEWANLTGDYADVDDYERMCVRCHREFDFKGRRPNGQFVSNQEVMPYV